MSVLLELPGILKNAEGNRVADKKQCVKTLLELYDNQDAIKEINENSKQAVPGQVTWTSIAHSVHNILLSEANRTAGRSESSTVSTNRRNMCALMLNTVSIANGSEGIFLECSDLTSLLLQVLSSKRYSSYHGTYITILEQYVLSVRQYWADMLSEHWKELLKICVALYKDPSPNMRKLIVLGAIQKLLQHGCLQSHLILDAKKLLSFFVKIFADIKEEALARSIYAAAGALCRQIGTESRIALCEFSEAILSDVIVLSESREKYDFLLLMVRIHHPGGACMGNGAAYACDWNKWQIILRGIYSTILGNCRSEVLTKSLLELASEVFRQVMVGDAISPVKAIVSYKPSHLPCSKKRRLSIGGSDEPTDRTIVGNAESVWPVIQILTATITKYPDSLKQDDFVPLLRVLAELLAGTCRLEEVVDSMCKLGIVLAEVQGAYPDDIVKNTNARVYWSNIWDVTLRLLETRQNEVFGHRLLQSLIRGGTASNTNALVRLYVRKAVGWSVSSIRTLIALEERATLPDDDVASLVGSDRSSTISNCAESVKAALVRWALDVPRTCASVPVEDLRRLLVGLTHKSRYSGTRRGDAWNASVPEKEGGRVLWDANARSLRDIERCHLSIEFECELLDEADAGTVGGDNEAGEGAAHVACAENALELLVGGLREFVGNVSTCECVDALVTRTALLAQVTSEMRRLNMVRGNVQDCSLVGVIGRSLERACALMKCDEDAPRSRRKRRSLVKIARAFRRLYRFTYEEGIARLVVSSTTAEALKSLLELTYAKRVQRGSDESWRATDAYIEERSNGESFDDDDDDEQLSWQNCSPSTEECALRMEALGALTAFTRVHCAADNSVQRNLSRALLRSDRYELADRMEFEMAMTLLESYGGRDESSLTYDAIERCVKLLTRICPVWYKNELAARRILNVVPRYLAHVTRTGQVLQRNNLNRILIKFHELIREENYGPLVSVEFVRCVGEVARSNPAHEWRRSDGNDGASEDVPIVDELLTYLNSPFYVVRLEAVRCLHAVFSSDLVDFHWLSSFFSKLKPAVTRSLFIVDGDLSGRERTDERASRVATALHAFATVICANGMFRCPALLELLRLIVDKEVGVDVVGKVLRVVAAAKRTDDRHRLIEDNLNYLLAGWLDSRYPLDLFPWPLTRCTSRADFCRRYACLLVPIKCRRGEMPEAARLCSGLGLSLAETIESCFPSIVSWLLPQVCADGPPDNKKLALETYERLTLNLAEFASIRKMSELLVDKVDRVIVCVIRRLHDEEHFGRLFETTPIPLPATDPPHFTSDAIRRCLERLTQEQHLSLSGRSLVQYLASERRDALQAILSALAVDIYDSTFHRHKLQAFHRYAYFCSAVIRELDRDYLDAMSTFVVREIAYTLLHLIDENDGELSEIGCKYFVFLTEHALPRRRAQVKEILSFVVAVLTPIVRAGRAGRAVAANRLLRHLIVDRRDILGEAIDQLVPFPNEPAFDDVRGTAVTYDLAGEMEHFLNANREERPCRSVEGLSRLRRQLSARKLELRAMYERLETLRGSAEDCVTSALHRTIHRLVKLMASDVVDRAVSLEAARCLGEIGPADLTTMILQPATRGRRGAKEPTRPIETLLYRATTLLSCYLVDRDYALRKASADALYVLLSSVWGRRLVEDKDYLELFVVDAEPPLRLDHVQPFFHRTSPSATSDSLTVDRIDEAKFKLCFDPNATAWTATSSVSHVDWVTDVTCGLVACLSNSYLDSLIAVCKLSPRFCESILPRLVHLIIVSTKTRSTDDVCRCIDRFFDRHFRAVEDIATAEGPASLREDATCLNRESIGCMLSVVNFVRLQSYGGDDDDARPTVALNYLRIAKAAQYCSAYFTSVLYAELWCEPLLSERSNYFDGLTAVDYICGREPNDGKSLQDVLREACIRIGDPDATYGCGSSYLLDRVSRVQHYVHLHKWDKVMLNEDTRLSSGGNPSLRGLLNALQQSGLRCLLDRFVGTTSGEAVENIDDFRYENLWRLSDWNEVTAEPRTTGSRRGDCRRPFQVTCTDDYHFYHYRALKCLRERDEVGLSTALDSSRASIVKSLRNASLESSKTVYPSLSQLRMLREIEELSSTAPEEYGRVIGRWQQRDFIDTNDFEYVEPVLSQRAVMCQIGDSLESNSIAEETLVCVYLNIIEVAEKQGQLQVATRALGTLAMRNDLSQDTRDLLQYREALLEWKTDSQDVARVLLRDLISRKELNAALRVRVLRVYGDWMAETKSENPQAVIERYYQRSIRESATIDRPTLCDMKNLYDAHASLARFADVQYRHIAAYTKSSQFESMKGCAEYSHQVAMKLNLLTRDSDVRRVAVLNEKQSRNDVTELENIESEKNMYLLLALRHYLITLRRSEDHDLLTFRLVSLWLDNMHHRELNVLFEVELGKIPCFKFIPLVPQLAPHMSNVSDVFSIKIYTLLESCAKEHPHHTLPVLLALMNMYEDYKFYEKKKISTRELQPRVLGARRLIERLLGTNVGPIVKEMNELAHSLIMLANLEIETRGRGAYAIPKSQKILNIKNLENLLVSTLTINVRASGQYDDIVGVYGYKKTFESVGGLNAPKKITCIGTDGICRNQLVKGKDDLRQDAVMQQVFTVMNSLLRASKETKRRKLNVRTYKVVPLTQRSGILQWCDNTSPIVNILAGSDQVSGVHRRYYPKDYTVQACKKKMMSVAAKSNDIKLSTFMDCCEHLHPAFHRFFTENYPSAETWFERRLAYTRSVATTSIIGYILGLGDRHLLNILLDVNTAEVIHIDFGIAFEQGKLLPTPETVPFRLTRDIEAAMGVSGVEGIMRRCCEQTMTVLRDQREIIITLLQVLLYDPLFSWAITPARAHNLQGGNTQECSSEGNRASGEINKLAERALLRIEQKLQGTEEGLPSSVAGQVERLIQQARDPANLSRLYYGWQPYL